jgi:hypothetical protein
MASMERTAETPLVHDLRRRMLRALENESYLELCHLLPATGHDTATTAIPAPATEKALSGDDWPEAARMLHAIPRDLLVSLVRNT